MIKKTELEKVCEDLAFWLKENRNDPCLSIKDTIKKLKKELRKVLK